MKTATKKRMGWYTRKYITVDMGELGEELSDFQVKIVDPMSLTPKDLESALKVEEGEELSVLKTILPKIVKQHNITHPETGEDLPQFEDDPDVVDVLPMFVIRFIVDKFMEQMSEDREVVPFKSDNSSSQR